MSPAPQQSSYSSSTSTLNSNSPSASAASLAAASPSVSAANLIHSHAGHRRQNSAAVAGTGPEASAALVGASLAFQKPKPKPPTLATSLPRDNGALAAATMSASASRGRSSSPAPSATPVSRTPTGPAARHGTGAAGNVGAGAGNPATEGSGAAAAGGGVLVRSYTQASQPASRLNTGQSSAVAAAEGAYHPPGAQGHAPARGRAGLAPDPRTSSSSVIAATLAAQRSASPMGVRLQGQANQGMGAQPSHITTAQQPASAAIRGGGPAVDRRSRRGSIDSQDAQANPDATDTSSIPPTKSIVSLFESKSSDATQPQKLAEINTKGRDVVLGLPPPRGSPPKRSSTLRLPPIERPVTPTNPSQQGRLGTAAAASSLPSSPTRPQMKLQERRQAPRTLSPMQKTPQPRAAEHPSPMARPPTPPKPTHLSLGHPLTSPPAKPHSSTVAPPAAAAAAAATVPTQTINLGSLITTDRINTQRDAAAQGAEPHSSRPMTATTTSSEDTFVSASSMPSPKSPRSQPATSPVRHQSAAAFPMVPQLTAHAPPMVHRSSSVAVTRPALPPPRRSQTTKSSTNPVAMSNSSSGAVTNGTSSHNSLPLTSLSDAILASSLAARITPQNTGASYTSERTTKGPPPLPARAKSPRLRETLRRPTETQSDDEADKLRRRRGRNKPLRKKHAHREGSRKRWRDEITDRERRRYEAVWASNRGLLLDDEHADDVANIVVRDIWKRSRLPDDELAEVWDLVDSEGRGLLNRREFVVGLWLLDQRLKGRKIPARVSDSVWDSAGGVRIQRPKAGFRYV